MGAYRLIFAPSNLAFDDVLDRVDAVLVPPYMVNDAFGMTRRTGVDVVTQVCTENDIASVKAAAALEAYNAGATDVVVPLRNIEDIDELEKEMWAIAPVRKGNMWFFINTMYDKTSGAAAKMERIPTGCGMWSDHLSDIEIGAIVGVPCVYDAGMEPFEATDTARRLEASNAGVCTEIVPRKEKASDDNLTITETELDL